MSYDIELVDPVTWATINIEAPHMMRGGTYTVGGTTELHLNMTYNYAPILCRVLKTDAGLSAAHGIDAIAGRPAYQTIPMLLAAIDQLGNDVDADYWNATEGNVKRALHQLLAMACMRPDGVWRVS
jgi:hypothetical protein